MKERIAVVGLPFVLLLAAVMAWGVPAGHPVSAADGAPALYEIALSGFEAGRLEVALPPGFEYAGLAAGSQVATGPELSGGGRRLVWQGPFPTHGALRFWIAPTRGAEAPATLPVVGADVQAVRVEPVTASPAARTPRLPSAAPTGTVSVAKTVTPDELEPGDSRWVTYEVVFSHPATETVVLDRITDTLPADFLFGGMAYGSDVITAPTPIGNNSYVWQQIHFTDTLTLRYNVRAVQHGGEYQNQVRAVAGGVSIGPASATLTIGWNLVVLPVVLREHRTPTAQWQVSKTANPTEAQPGDPIDYTVVIRNVGDATGGVGTIWDFIPTEFTFLTMLPGSEIATPPTVKGPGWLEWWSELNPWLVPAGGDLILKYQVQAGGGGPKTNTVQVYRGGAALLGTASSTVTVGTPLPFQDDFTNGLSADWQPFLNWPGLSANRWYWSGELGSWGILNYEYDRVLPGNEGYDLIIYNAPGAQEWTDYRIEARLKDVKQTGKLNRGFVGLWFRGTYQNSGAMDGKTVGGYYFYMKEPDDTLYLMRTPPDNPTFASQSTVASYKWSAGLGRKHWYKMIVEVRGTNIKAWFEDDEDGTSNPVKVFDWNDPLAAWPRGTVGFSAFYSSARFDYIYVLPLD